MTSDATIRITLDAAGDLAAAGHDISEADAFATAYEESMASLGAALGVDIRVSRDPSATQTATPGPGGETLEAVLWQAAHNATGRSRDGEWTSADARPSRKLRDLVDAALRGEDLARGETKIGASEEPNGSYVYYEQGTDRHYRVTADDVADLGARMRRADEDEDTYSIWCAATEAEELPADYEVAA